ncbi:MAG: hypothetical protein KDA20_03735 [Phycisphaerales bacterium]|nr:hypothetical protein [Phycisphaerales bacterium]
MQGHSPQQFDQLVAWAAGECSLQEHLAAERAIANDPALKALADQLTAIFDGLQAHEQPTAALKARLARLLDESGAPSVLQRAKDWIANAERCVATMILGPHTALAGFRSAPTSQQYAFTSALGRLDLLVAPGAGAERAALKGQFAPTSQPAKAALLMTPAREPLAHTTVDERGRFELNADPGEYALVLDVDGAALDCTIVVPQG